MAIHQRQSHIQVQGLRQKIEPQLLLTNRLLQMGAMELQQCVAQELTENPALEPVDLLECTGCDGSCPVCLASASLSSRYRLRDEWGARFGLSDAPEEFDPLELVQAPRTLRDHLLDQLGDGGVPERRRIVEYLIACVDEDGYLRITLEETARDLEVPRAEVEAVLALVQACDPPGVAARSLQECLLLQARALAEEEDVPPQAAAILEQYWKELAARKWSIIARRLRVSLAEVERTVVWIREHLSPYPGSRYRAHWERDAERESATVVPDVLILLGESGRLEVDLRADYAREVQINAQYARLWREIQQGRRSFSEGERKHVRDYLVRAQRFLRGLGDRGAILARVAERLVDEQERFLRTERDEDLLPMTQTQLASFLRVHESTVSRAIAGKFLQLPSGRVVPMSLFFDRSLGLRRLVANIVASEDPAAPYSDQQISDILRRQGVVLARRTILKYREEMNILSSRRRARQAPRARQS